MIRTSMALSVSVLLALAGCNKGSSAAPGPSTTLGSPAAAPASVTAGAAGSASRSRVCKNPPATGLNSLACGHCIERECSAALDTLLSSCPVYLSCVQGCDCSDRSCLMGCAPKIDAPCRTGSVDIEACKKTHCAGPDTCDVKH
jgi:hypothetical protein